MSTTTALTIPERGKLEQLEAVIQEGLGTFVKVGLALLTIKEEQLYRDGYDTFENYCRVRWNMTRQHANRLIRSTDVVRNLLPLTGEMEPIGSISDTSGAELPLPENEFQARPLADLEPAEQREAWTEAVATSRNGKPTSEDVQEVVDRRKGKSHEGADARAKADERIRRQQANGTLESHQAEGEPDDTDGPLKDQEGHEIPEKALPAFQQAAELNAACRQLDDLIREVERLGKSPVGAHLHYQSVQTHLKNAKNGLWTARPTHVCPYCKGKKKTCDACRAHGWVTASTYKAAPEELRKS